MATSGGDSGDSLGRPDSPDLEGPGPDDPEFGGLAEFGEGAGAGWLSGVDGLDVRLFEHGYRFDFFQAVRILQRLPGREPVGHDARPTSEAVSFRVHQTLGFPASAVQWIQKATPGFPPVLWENFLGLTGPSGVLPLHYSELLLHHRGHAGTDLPLRDWFDLFNHRLVSFFYRTWEKYRAVPAFERGESWGIEPDAFTLALVSLLGLGIRPLRGRLSIPAGKTSDEGPPAPISDLTLIHHAGLLSHRPPNAIGLERLLGSVFGVAVEVREFCGQWLVLAEDQQTRLGRGVEGNSVLGVSAVAGSRTYDVQGRFQVRIGPLLLDDFVGFLPIEQGSGALGRPIGRLFRLVRLYAGPELEFEVRLVLRGDQVTPCRLSPDDPVGPRLGWNTWLAEGPLARDRDDASFTDDFPRG